METKEVKKKSVEEYYDDLVEYIAHRILLSINAVDDEETVKDIKTYVDCTLYLLMNDGSIKDTISRIIHIDDLSREFEDTFGDRYNSTFNCCQNKIDNEIKTDNNICGGC